MPIENHEGEPIEVESFSKTCNCLSVEPESFVLEPGERRELHLQIDLTKQTKPTGEATVQLRPRLKVKPGMKSAKRRPPEWSVIGYVHRALAVERQVDLGRHSELSQPLTARIIPVEVLVPLESLSAQCSSPNFAASVELPPNGQGKTVLRLNPTMTLPEGAFQGTVSVKGVRKDGKPLPVRNVEFLGIIVPDVEAIPPAVQVGGRCLGETFEEIIVLRSMTGRVMEAISAEAEGEGLSVEAGKENGSYRIRQKVCGVGSRINRVRFSTTSGKHRVLIAVPVTYTGIEAQ